MTKEEAREILTHNWTRVDNPNYSESDLDEAFFMAIESLSADAMPTVIRSRTLMPTKDFKEWAKRIREENPNVIVIPCDAEVVSANAEQGVWEHIESTLADNMFKCSKCGNPLIIPTVDGEPIYNYCLHCGAKMGNAWGERND